MTSEGTVYPKARYSPPTALVAAGLVMLTFLTFFGVWRNGFIDYDDNTYVFLNPNIIRGLDWQTVQWAFGYVNACHWVPLTWLSYALDCQLYGLNAAGFHVTNLLLHMATVVLLFFGLHRLTGSVWRSSLVAAIFAIHPLRVESVAWVAERKDVLSGLFFMLTLLAYTRYAQSTSNYPSKAEHRGPVPASDPVLWYLLALGAFVLGLMSKSILVTMPFLFLLLDFWPLGRIETLWSKEGLKACAALAREKWPFFALSLVCSLITFLAQDVEIREVGPRPLTQRIGNALLACVGYLRQTFWPTRLSIFYPPEHVSVFSTRVVSAFAVLLALSVIAFVVAQRRRHIFVGWFWYLGVLTPVSGVLQVGEMIQADRYTYLPTIGIYLLIVWEVVRIAATQTRSRPFLATFAVAIVGLLAVSAHQQIPLWRNTHSIFAHAARVTRNNYVARTMLAKEDLDQGRISECISNAQEILGFAPKFPSAEYLLGSALQMQGRMAEAIPHLEASVGPEVRVPGKARLVISYLDAGRLGDAEQALAGLTRMVGGGADLWLMRAALLKEEGRTGEALQVFNGLMSHNPGFHLDTPTMNFELAELYSLQGSNRQAVAFYTKALEISPQYTNALNNCAWILATDTDDQVRDGTRAVELAQHACELSEWQQPVFIGTLAAAYAEAGRFDDAVKTAEKARDLAQKQGNDAVAKRNSELLELYRQGKAYRERTA